MSARVRVIAVASLLVVFFGVGAVWLVRRATSTGSKPVAATADEVQQTAGSSDPSDPRRPASPPRPPGRRPRRRTVAAVAARTRPSPVAS